MDNQNVSEIGSISPDLGSKWNLEPDLPVNVQSGTNYGDTIYYDHPSISFGFISTQFDRVTFDISREPDGSVEQTRLLDSFGQK